MVVFPAPEEPMKATVFPLGIRKLAWLMTGSSESG